VRSIPGKPQTISLTTIVTNQGPVAAGPFGVALILMPFDGPGAGGPRVVGTRQVPGLASNAVSTASTVVTLPADLGPGVWELHAVADYNGLMPELDENNNEAVGGTLTIFDSVGRPYQFTVFLDTTACGGTDTIA